jgi:5-methyltetrahydrofolate corrinoid/iron sulfur protein methyltransferase
MILQKYGMGAAIVDAFDDDLKTFARGDKPEMSKLVSDVVDGQEPELASLSREQVDYVKTTKILLGHSLYSDSWLEI